MKDVRVTLRLTESPACLVADEHDMSGNLERLLKAAGQKVRHAKPILEINPHHPLDATPEIGRGAASTTGAMCCSTRRYWLKVASLKTLRAS